MGQDKDYMNNMDDNIEGYIEPEGEIIEPTPDLKLWNPATAVWLSFLISPVFGAVIHAINWYKLNDLVRMKWNIIWVLMVILTVVSWDILVGERTSSLVFWMAIFWYFAIGKSQSKTIKESGIKYDPKPWYKPILITFGIIILVFLTAY